MPFRQGIAGPCGARVPTEERGELSQKAESAGRRLRRYTHSVNGAILPAVPVSRCIFTRSRRKASSKELGTGWVPLEQRIMQ